MKPLTRTIRFASGVSDESDTGEALDDTLGPITDALGEGPVDLAVLFVSPHHAGEFPRIVQRLHRQLKPKIAIGVTAGAVLGSGVEIEKRAGIAAIAAHLPGVDVHAFGYDDLNWPDSEGDPGALRRGVAGKTTKNPAGVLLFADPFSTPMVKLMPALNAALPGVPFVGGMASAGVNPGDNRLLLNDRILREGAVGVSLGGNIRVDCTVSQGCRPVGQPMIITRAKHNVIHELGGRPALKVIRDMAEAASDEDRALMQGGLLIGRVISEYKDRFGRGDFLIRNIVGADEDAGYIAIADLIRVGQTVQFHVRDGRAAEEDLGLLLEAQRLHGPAAGAVLCTCNGRGSHMFPKPNVESALIGDALGHAPIAGFFAAGEIGPIGNENFLHGFTASMAVFRPA